MCILIVYKLFPGSLIFLIYHPCSSLCEFHPIDWLMHDIKKYYKFSVTISNLYIMYSCWQTSNTFHVRLPIEYSVIARIWSVQLACRSETNQDVPLHRLCVSVCLRTHYLTLIHAFKTRTLEVLSLRYYLRLRIILEFVKSFACFLCEDYPLA